MVYNIIQHLVALIWSTFKVNLSSLLLMIILMIQAKWYIDKNKLLKDAKKTLAQ